MPETIRINDMGNALSFEEIGRLPLIAGQGAVPALLISPSFERDGTLVAYMRDNGGPPQRAMRATSSDAGATWTVARDTELLNPGSSLEVVALADGRWAMALNDAEHGRHDLTLALAHFAGAGASPWRVGVHYKKCSNEKMETFVKQPLPQTLSFSPL